MMLKKLILETSSRCNFTCKHCPISYNQTPADFDINLLYKLKNTIENCEEISLFGWGEPLINPDFLKLVSLIREISKKVRIYFTTNGSLLNKKACDHFINNRVDYISISLDSLKNPKLREIPLDIIINNVKYLVQNGNDHPHIRFNVTLNALNIYELPKIIEFSHSLGLKEINCVFMTAFFKSQINQTLKNRISLINEEFKKSRKVSEKLGIKLRLPDLSTPKTSCEIAVNELFITSHGTIKPCLCYPKNLGNLSNQNIEDILNSTEYNEEIKKIKNNGICDFCYKCQYLNIQNGKGFDFTDDMILKSIFNS